MNDTENAYRRPGWLLNEMVTAGRENLDEVHVGQYDQKENARASEEVELLTTLGLGDRSTVVDIGAGTGQFALAVARRCERIVAVDISPVMLNQLRSKVEASGLENIELAQAGFVTYEHSGSAADFVYSRWALHHLPDFWKSLALRRMREMLRDGGVLRLADIVFSFDVAEAEERIESWCASLPDVAQNNGDWVRADIEDHVRDEHSTYTWLLEPMIERAGFRIDQVDHSDDGFYASYIARAI